MKFYAVKKGKKPGVYLTWKECQEQVSGYSGAVFRSFTSKEEAEQFAKCEEQDESQCKVHIYTDGSADGIKGGYGYVVVENDKIVKEGSGSVPYTPCWSDIAELYAIKMALTDVRDNVILFADNKYSVDVFSTWIHGWKLNGWKTSKGEDAKNKELIQEIDQLLQERTVIFKHIKGHNGHKYNERADALANINTM